MFKLALLTLATATLTTLAVPMQERSLPTGTVTCGSDKYSPSAISAAITKGQSLYTAGKTLGSDAYPHAYYTETAEHISLYCSGSTYSEFPIMSNGAIYSGGSPGADRVIFNTSGVYCAVVTHTGAASYDGFTSCQND